MNYHPSQSNSFPSNRSIMDKYLRAAIEDILRTSHRCSQDSLGYIQYMPMDQIAMLHLQYDKYCRKHFKPKVRPEVAA